MVLVNDGIKQIMNRFAKSSPDYNAPTNFRLGIGVTAAAIDDTAVETQIPIAGIETIDDCEATTGWSANLTNSITLNNTTFRVGSGALNIVKDATGNATAFGEKVIASVDFTSKDLWIMLYSNDSNIQSSEIRLGSDSNNYFSFTPTLIDGDWIFAKFNSSTATTVGTPVIGSCDYLYVGVTTDDATDTLAAGTFIFDNVILASSDDYTKAFEATYPTINENSMEVAYRCKAGTTHANGFSITEFAIENDDVSIKLLNHDTFAGISKTSSDELIFITKLRFLR